MRLRPIRKKQLCEPNTSTIFVSILARTKRPNIIFFFFIIRKVDFESSFDTYALLFKNRMVIGK